LNVKADDLLLTLNCNDLIDSLAKKKVEEIYKVLSGT